MSKEFSHSQRNSRILPSVKEKKRKKKINPALALNPAFFPARNSLEGLRVCGKGVSAPSRGWLLVSLQSDCGKACDSLLSLRSTALLISASNHLTRLLPTFGGEQLADSDSAGAARCHSQAPVKPKTGCTTTLHMFGVNSGYSTYCHSRTHDSFLSKL